MGVRMAQREQWATRTGFILAAAGSAIGLGDVWRFPYIAYQNGGGAFFVPYLFAFLTAGIPILLLEYTIGHRFRGSAPLSFLRLGGKKAEWIGWWQIAISFVIGCYYAIIIAWALSYFLFSFGLSWGGDPEAYFFESYIRAADEPGTLGGPVIAVLVPLLGVWIFTLFTLSRGVQRGIERASRIMMPVFFVLFIMIVIRAVTLPGASDGLNTLFTPDWDAITDSKVWIAAYGQIFFSLSIAFAIMITYASYLPKKSDLTNTSLIVGFSNSSTELLAGIGVFAALGFMAQSTGTPVTEVATDGIGLVFVAFPALINELPALNTPFAVVFFLSLVVAGFTSQISIVECCVAGVQEKFDILRSRAVWMVGGVMALISLLFATRGGLYALDAADYFINNFGAVTAGLLEVVLVAWILRRVGELQNHANAVSDIPIGGWWKVSLTFITPVMLGYMLVDNTITNLTSNYEDYPTGFLRAYGWGILAASIIAALAFTMKTWNRSMVDLPEEAMA